MEQNLKVWEELAIDVNGKLTGEMRKEYIKILEAEFNNQSTLYHNQINEIKSQLVEKHRKKVNHEKLVDDIAKAQANLEHAKKKLAKTGLDENGELVQGYYGDAEARDASRKVQVEIDKLTASIKAPTTYKNKVITRLLGATKIGEAQFIMRQVLGNGVLIDVDLKAITHEA